MVRFRVDFNKPNLIFLPGEEVSCVWHVELTEIQAMRSLYVRHKGEVETKWTESRTVRVNGKSRTKHVHYRGFHSYFNQQQALFGRINGPEVTLPAGQYTYQTMFRLPENLPPSFEGE